MLTGEAAAVAATLADDVAFYTPAFIEPTRGRATVAAVLAMAKQVYGEMLFTEALTGDGAAALFFEAEVDGHQLQGCYRLHVSADALVQRLDVFTRPLEATRALVAAMMSLSQSGQHE